MEHDNCPVAGLMGSPIGRSGPQHYPVYEVLSQESRFERAFAMIEA